VNSVQFILKQSCPPTAFQSFRRNRSNLVPKIFLFLLTISAFQLDVCQAKGLKDYISKNYLEKHDLYDNLPEHQFKELGKTECNDFLMMSDIWPVIAHEYVAFNDGIFLFKLMAQMKFSLEKYTNVTNRDMQTLVEFKAKAANDAFKDVSKQIFLNSVCTTKRGVFLFYFYNKIEKKSGEFLVEDRKGPRKFFYGFGIVRDGKVYSPADKIESIDPKYGLYSKKLWDVFTFEEKEYMLLLDRGFDVYTYEVYEISDDTIKLALKYDFGG